MKKMWQNCQKQAVKGFTLIETRISKSVIFYSKFSSLYQ